MENHLHLYVILHGLNGFASDLEILSEKIKANVGVELFVPECNQGKTWDGLENGARRIFNCVSSRIKKIGATHVSFIGCALGGLYARYLVGLLHQAKIIPAVKPVNFITIDTPHLGSRSSAFGFAQDVKTLLDKLLLNQTGKDLMLISRNGDDARPVLMELLDDMYIEPLKCFQNLITYFNSGVSDSNSCSIKKQSTVKSPEKTSKKSVGVEEDRDCGEPSQQLLAKNMSQEPVTEPSSVEDQMLLSLNKLNWKRFIINTREKMTETKSGWAMSSPILNHIIGIIKSSMVITTPSTNEFPPPPLPETQSESNDSDIHLVVLIHGLDGFSSDLEFIAKRLQQRFTTPLRTLSPKCNHWKTHDGIMNGAQRILECVLKELEHPGIKYISIIGHSLGGLYARCLVGLLYKHGVIPDKVIPINFITLATPHLGSREHAKILGEKFTSLVLGSVIGLTGKGIPR